MTQPDQVSTSSKPRRAWVTPAVAVVLLAAEVAIARFAPGGSFLRVSVGDILAVALVYAVIRSFPRATPAWALAISLVIALTVELLQLARITSHLGIAPESLLGIVLGSTFSWGDLAMYLVGGGLAWGFDRALPARWPLGAPSSRSRLAMLITVITFLTSARMLPGQGTGPVAGTLSLERRIPLPDDVSYVRGGTFGPNGTLVLTLASDRLIAYDTTLRTYAPVGRGGEGPGEFTGVASLFWLGDSLAVYDDVQRRLSVFAGGRRFVRSVSTAFWQGIPSGRFDTGAWAATRWSGGVRPTADNPARGELVAIVEENPVRVLPLASRPAIGTGTVSVRIGTGRSMVSQPFGERPRLGFSPARKLGWVVEVIPPGRGSRAEIQISWIGSRGEVVERQVESFPLRMRPSGARERYADSLVDQLLAGRGAVPARVRNEAKKSVIEQLHFPPYVPPLRWAQADGEGGMWLQVIRSGEPAEVICRVDRSAAVRTVCAPLPARASPVAVGADRRLFLQIFDADDVPELFEFRLR